MDQKGLAFIFLRFAIASVFIYAAIASFLAPEYWVEFFPHFLQNALPQNILIDIFSAYEMLLAVWLSSGKFTFYAALLAILTLGGIIVFNLTLLDIVFVMH